MKTTTRKPTEHELKMAQDLAEKLIDAMDGTPPDLRFGAVSLLVSGMFSIMTKAEYRVQAFEEFCETTRRVVRKSMT